MVLTKGWSDQWHMIQSLEIYSHISMKWFSISVPKLFNSKWKKFSINDAAKTGYLNGKKEPWPYLMELLPAYHMQKLILNMVNRRVNRCQISALCSVGILTASLNILLEQVLHMIKVVLIKFQWHIFETISWFLSFRKLFRWASESRLKTPNYLICWILFRDQQLGKKLI